MIYEFDTHHLDTRRCELRRGDECVHLEPQVYAVLCYLLANRDRLVRKEELLDHIWGHRFVTPATLNSRIKALRKALGDSGSEQQTIQTVRGLGFRFLAEVAERSESGRIGAGSEPPGETASTASVDPSSPAAPSSRTTAQDQQIRFYLSRDRARIAYATSGAGPPLIKTANWLTHLEHDWHSPVWRHWMRELSRDHTLVRCDQRGSGLSDWEVEDVSFERWVEDLEYMLDAIGEEIGDEPVPLLGVSQGCALAVAFAARFPERVSRLVLYGGFARGRYRRAMTPAEEQQARMVVEVMPLGWGQDNPAFRQFFATMFLPEGTPEQMRWFSDLQRITTTPENGVRLRTASAEIDVVELAERVRAPTLVLHATGDAAVPFEEGRLLAALIPGARLVPLESRNHVLLESEPAWPRFLEEVRAFLAADGASRPFSPGSPAVAPIHSSRGARR